MTKKRTVLPKQDWLYAMIVLTSVIVWLPSVTQIPDKKWLKIFDRLMTFQPTGFFENVLLYSIGPVLPDRFWTISVLSLVLTGLSGVVVYITIKRINPSGSALIPGLIVVLEQSRWTTLYSPAFPVEAFVILSACIAGFLLIRSKRALKIANGIFLIILLLLMVRIFSGFWEQKYTPVEALIYGPEQIVHALRINLKGFLMSIGVGYSLIIENMYLPAVLLFIGLSCMNSKSNRSECMLLVMMCFIPGMIKLIVYDDITGLPASLVLYYVPLLILTGINIEQEMFSVWKRRIIVLIFSIILFWNAVNHGMNVRMEEAIENQHSIMTLLKRAAEKDFAGKTLIAFPASSMKAVNMDVEEISAAFRLGSYNSFLNVHIMSDKQVSELEKHKSINAEHGTVKILIPVHLE